jgi:hypothetical protein
MWLQKHRPELAGGVAKRDPRLLRVLEAVEREYDDGRVTSLADSEVDELVSRAFAASAGV